jgi:8-oxo-dGTP pyrophosphatase MutT (NUDIX family)
VLSDWAVLVTLIVVAASYVIGILVDRFADSLHSRLRHVWPERPVDKPAGLARMRLVLLCEGGALANFLEYQRSRLRIARSTAVNAALAAPAAVAFLALRTDAGVPSALGVAAALLGTAGLSELTFRRVEFAYVSRLSDAYRLVMKSKDKADRAAAIPFRREDGRVLFGLVTTKGDEEERWTFPKGRPNPKKDESLADTARREAKEEAGLRGRLEGKRLLEYDYPPRKGEPHRVAAFLLEARPGLAKQMETDTTRKVGWFTPDEAVRRLRQNREPEFGAEAERVVAKALELICEDRE